MTLRKWDVTFSNYTHSIIFKGTTISGKAKIEVDGTETEYAPVLVKHVGIFYRMMVDGSEFLLKLDLRYRVSNLSRNGIDTDTGLPLDETILEAYRTAQKSPQSPDFLLNKDKLVTGTIGIFVILTIFNLLMTLAGTGYYFPFSAIVPQVLLSYGLSLSSSLFLSIILIITAFICAGVYFLLLTLSVKYTWPIFVTLILMILDTIALAAYIIVNINTGITGSIIVNVVIHGLVLWSVLDLIITLR
jgi:hypothetical protein